MSLSRLVMRPVRFLILASLSGALVGALAAAALSGPLGRWNASVSFTIDQRPRAETKDYAYDGYYALKASELFGDTLIGWFRTPSVARDLYRIAELDLTDEEAARAASGFRLKRLSSQVVSVAFSRKDEREAERLASAAVRLMTEKTAALNRDGEGRPLFVLEAERPLIARDAPSPSRFALAGALAAAALAAGATLFVSPRREEDR